MDYVIHIPDELVPGVIASAVIANTSPEQIVTKLALEMANKACQDLFVGPYYKEPIMPAFNPDGTPYVNNGSNGEKITGTALVSRLTPSEYLAISNAMEIRPDSTEAEKEKARLVYSFVEEVKSMTVVNLNDPRLINGLKMLVDFGIITEARSEMILESKSISNNSVSL